MALFLFLGVRFANTIANLQFGHLLLAEPSEARKVNSRIKIM
jgi:hypothetical protein